MSIRPITRDPEMTDAFEVAEYMLEATRQAYADRNFVLFAKRFALPQTIGTFDGDVEIATIEQLEEFYHRACNYFDSNDIIDVQRKTIAAQFISPDVVETTYSSRHLYRTYMFSDEVIGTGTIRNFDGIWKITGSRYATNNPQFSNVIAVPKPDKPKD